MLQSQQFKQELYSVGRRVHDVVRERNRLVEAALAHNVSVEDIADALKCDVQAVKDIVGSTDNVTVETTSLDKHPDALIVAVVHALSKEYSISQIDLAGILDVSPFTVSKVLKGNDVHRNLKLGFDQAVSRGDIVVDKDLGQVTGTVVTKRGRIKFDIALSV
jgi:plasmid maintenance system antidote protein VapI